MNTKLKDLRIKNNYTSKYIADLLGISKPFYSQIENGRRRLSYDMAVKIAKIFKMMPDELFYNDHKKMLKKEKKV
jgi:putative transcriptional regulator